MNAASAITNSSTAVATAPGTTRLGASPADERKDERGPAFSALLGGFGASASALTAGALMRTLDAGAARSAARNAESGAVPDSAPTASPSRLDAGATDSTRATQEGPSAGPGSLDGADAGAGSGAPAARGAATVGGVAGSSGPRGDAIPAALGAGPDKPPGGSAPARGSSAGGAHTDSALPVVGGEAGASPMAGGRGGAGPASAPSAGVGGVHRGAPGGAALGTTEAAGRGLRGGDLTPRRGASLLRHGAPEPDPALQAQLRQSFTAAMRSKDGVAMLRLNPAHLGTLMVRVEVQDGRVSAELRVSSDQARGLLEAHRSALRDALDARGLVVDRVVVSEQAAGEARDGSETVARDSGQGRPGAGREDRAAEPEVGRTDEGGAPLTEGGGAAEADVLAVRIAAGMGIDALV